MSDYPIARARSAAIIRSASVDRSPTILLSRTYSVPDLTTSIRYSDKYRPTWYTYYPRYYYNAPYRYYRDYSLADSYWNDRYYYFSPLYQRSLAPRRYYYSDYVANPYYWSGYPTRYYNRYKSYWYDYDRSNYRSHYDPWYNYYLRSSYYPYRSYLLDSMEDSLLQGLKSYRSGVISYGTFYNNYVSPSWDHYVKDYKKLYLWDKDYAPTDQKPRSYVTSWVS